MKNPHATKLALVPLSSSALLAVLGGEGTDIIAEGRPRPNGGT